MFKKPHKLKYTDMCIYIDKHIYTDDCDDTKVYQYLYHLTMMLAYKAHYFDTYQKYEDFGLFAARYYYLRLKSPKQYEFVEEKNKTRLGIITNILDYIKASLYGVKVTFEHEEYAQYSNEQYLQNYLINSYYNLSSKIVETADKFNHIDFFASIEDIADEIKDVLKDIPYKNDKSMWNNIYLSCLLTINNSVTLSNWTKKRLETIVHCDEKYYDILNKEYDKNNEDCVILYHLDKDMKDYIKLLCTLIKKRVSNELSSISNSYISTDVLLSGMIVEEVENED